MQSMVEGASEAQLRCRRGRIVEADAPSTALRAVPLPHLHGGGQKAVPLRGGSATGRRSPCRTAPPSSTS